MRPTRFTARGLLAGLALALAFSALPDARQATATATSLPSLTNAEFWQLATTLSEPDGTFHSENLVSNETRFQEIIPDLVRRVVPGRAYVGVGSEQNFTYIAATKPSHVFILDIRRGNLDLHLLYKALFETSADRVEFVSRMFGRPRPAGLDTSATAETIFAAFDRVAPNEALRKRTYDEVIAHLTKTHGFALSDGDKQGIVYVQNTWFESGPDISYQLNGIGAGGGFGRRGGGRAGSNATYADLMTASDDSGKNWSYLANDENFRTIKNLELRNRIVPIVGNFGGPKALRAVAAYLKKQNLVVSTFYTSNVQQYLVQDGIWEAFRDSARMLPMDDASTMIRSERGGFAGARGVGVGFTSELLPLREALAARP